jgi:N,N'-diacetyllegionaminate synthase
MPIDQIKVIAEAGINHGGNVNRAALYIEAASQAGADFVKFHIALAKNMVDIENKRKAWSDNHPEDVDPIDKFVQRMEFTETEWQRLINYSQDLNIKMIFTVYDIEAADQALKLGVKTLKLASCDFTNSKLINYLTPKVDKLYLATGMVDEAELKKQMSTIDKSKTEVMHCVSLYPSPLEALNLKCIETLRKFGIKTGYSDHLKGIEACLLSLQFNPSIIEKHFMLDDDHACADKNVSCSPEQLKTLVEICKEYESIIGDGDKYLTNAELNNRIKLRGRWA